MISVIGTNRQTRWQPRTTRDAIWLLLRLCVGTAVVAAFLHLLLPGPAFFVILVMVGPVAVWLCHPSTDGQTATLGALVSGSATVALFLLALIASLLLFIVALVTGESTALPVAFETSPIVCIGSAVGGGAASLVARILADAIGGPA